MLLEIGGLGFPITETLWFFYYEKMLEMILRRKKKTYISYVTCMDKNKLIGGKKQKIIFTNFVWIDCIDWMMCVFNLTMINGRV